MQRSRSAEMTGHVRRNTHNGITRITNRLGSVLKQYYPQALDWFEHRNTIIFCDFLTRWPTVVHARRARAATLQAFFHSHHCCRTGLVAARIQSIRSSIPLTEDPATIRPAHLTVQTLVAQLRVLIAALERFDEEIEAISKEIPDYKLFVSLPGAGHIQALRLLVAFGEGRDRFASAGQVQQYAGIAPIIERSGNRCWVHWRFACSTFLRQTFVEWAGSAITRSSWAATFYRQQRSKGAEHGVAIRAFGVQVDSNSLQSLDDATAVQRSNLFGRTEAAWFSAACYDWKHLKNPLTTGSGRKAEIRDVLPYVRFRLGSEHSVSEGIPNG